MKDRIKVDKPTVAQEAESLIYGERVKHYGPPHINFDVIARLWEAYMRPRVLELIQVAIDEGEDTDAEAVLRGEGRIVDENDVCNLMTLLKVAREATGQGYHHDSTVDIIGYQAIKEILQTPIDQFLKEL